MKNFPKYRFGDVLKKITREELSKHASGITLVGLADDSAIKNVGGRTGARFAPDKIRERLHRFTTRELRYPIYDIGNIEPLATIEKTHAAARSLIGLIHKNGHIPVVMGGGHDLAFPEARALLDYTISSVGFLNVDAHLDLRPTDQGITSGSPWNLLLKEKDYSTRKCQLVEWGIQEHCNSPQLLEIALQNKVIIHWLREIRMPRDKSFALTLKKLTQKHKAVQVSLDIDAVQACQAPGCSAPQVLGLQAQEFIRCSELAGANSRVRSFGVYEVSPLLDFDQHTATLAAQSILAFIHGVGERKSRLY